MESLQEVIERSESRLDGSLGRSDVIKDKCQCVDDITGRLGLRPDLPAECMEAVRSFRRHSEQSDCVDTISPVHTFWTARSTTGTGRQLSPQLLGRAHIRSSGVGIEAFAQSRKSGTLQMGDREVTVQDWRDAGVLEDMRSRVHKVQVWQVTIDTICRRRGASDR